VEEESPLNPGPWLRSALEGESLVQQAQVDGLPAVVVRPGFLYAPDAWHTRWLVENLRSRGFRVPGRGENYVSPIHAEDAARAFIAAAKNAEPGETFLAADDRPLPLREFADTWAEALGVRSPKSAPPFLARLAVGREAVEYATMSQRLSNRRARERLGWRPQYPTVKDGAAMVARLLAGKDMDRAGGS
jgi:nucleoside-diphosphate-sugar epimerase